MNLRAGDLTQDGNTALYNVRAKGGIERHRELPAPAFAAINTALATQGRPLENLMPEERLFDVSHWGFGKNLARYAKKAKLGHVTPHALRHSAAKLRRETGASIEDIGALLGHRSLATTASSQYRRLAPVIVTQCAMAVEPAHSGVTTTQ